MEEMLFFPDETTTETLNKILELTHSNYRTSSFNYRINAQQLIDRILGEPRYQDPKRLEKYGFKAYSQNDEDGILAEIFHRIGVGNSTFVEFGTQDGLESNSLYLLYQGWSGLWIEADPAHCDFIHQKFATLILSNALKIANEFVTRDNINQILKSNQFGGEIALLSIDIDGNDYHIWEAIDVISPRVVVIEYNAKFRPPVQFVIEYNTDHVWDGTDYFGGSLKSYELLGQSKGYKLVGCNLVGVNAFFVREDLVADLFQAPFTAENFHHPARYYLANFYAAEGGWRANFGPYLRQ